MTRPAIALALLVGVCLAAVNYCGRDAPTTVTLEQLHEELAEEMR